MFDTLLWWTLTEPIRHVKVAQYRTAKHAFLPSPTRVHGGLSHTLDTAIRAVRIRSANEEQITMAAAANKEQVADFASITKDSRFSRERSAAGQISVAPTQSQGRLPRPLSPTPRHHGANHPGPSMGAIAQQEGDPFLSRRPTSFHHRWPAAMTPGRVRSGSCAIPVTLSLLVL